VSCGYVHHEPLANVLIGSQVGVETAETFSSRILLRLRPEGEGGSSSSIHQCPLTYLPSPRTGRYRSAPSQRATGRTRGLLSPSVSRFHGDCPSSQRRRRVGQVVRTGPVGHPEVAFSANLSPCNSPGSDIYQVRASICSTRCHCRCREVPERIAPRASWARAKG
jgi:hypothetical protein